MKNKTVKLSILLVSLMGVASAVDVPHMPDGKSNASDATDKRLTTSRFIVNGDCATDRLTGLMWAKNATIGFESTSGGGLIAQPDYTNTRASLNGLTWLQAAPAIAQLNAAQQKLCGYSDWRLPNITELEELVNYAIRHSSSTPATWLNSKGFVNVQADAYWSSTTFDSRSARSVYFGNGEISLDDESSSLYILPVRGGR